MKYSLLLISLFGISVSFAQKKDNKKWDVNNPPGPYKTVNFTVNEGTWMNVDISPDGKTLVFDLLGDLYTLPVSGGEAKPLRTNLAFEVQPRFSPDGKHILFTSDAGGGDNIWLMKTGDTASAKAITKEDFRLLNNAAFTPDGQYIVARKHFTSGRSLGAGEMWIYHLSGGSGLQLTARKNDQQDVNEPVVSPDNRYVYYCEDMYPGGFFQYNKDPNNQIYVIKRYDRKEGKIENVTGGGGGASRPQLSHDGNLLSFIRRVRTKSVLYIRNLQTGEEYPVYDKLSKDQQEAWAIFGTYPNYSFTPDDKHIVIWANGKIWKVDVNKANTATEIPFTAKVTQRIADVVRFKQNLDEKDFTVNVLRDAVTSPDGKTLVFNAVGKLYKQPLPNGNPVRLTKMGDIEAQPAFSADGKNLVFVTWNDSTMSSIYTMDVASGRMKKVLEQKQVLQNPSFSPDGKTIVYENGDGDGVLGSGNNLTTGVYTIDVNGGKPKFISESGSNPKFNKSGDRIITNRGSNLRMYDLSGNNSQDLFKGQYGSQYTISPDGNWVAFVYLHNVYIGQFPEIGKTIDLASNTSSIPVKVVSKDAGTNLHWSGDGKQLHYTLGNQYFTIPLEDRFEFVANKPDSLFKVPEKGTEVKITMPVDIPKGSIAFTNARIITMNGDEVIENGTIVIEGNKIKAVGANLPVPAGAKQIDASGKTIMPGFIDAHAHAGHFRSGLTPQKHWPYYTNLAYGVTTMFDPSANSEMVFTQSEMVKAGEMVGPRVFSTGTILYGADGSFKAVINSLDDALSALRRTKAFGANAVKSYNQPRREQNQMVLEAARQLKMNVVPEGGSFFYHNVAMVNDGHTTVEHNLPIGVLHDDVINLWKNSGTAYTPTLIVNYAGPGGEYYWYQHTNVWEKERLLRFTPRSVIDMRSRWRTMLPEEEYENGHILTSKHVKKLNDNGVLANIGAHGQIQGIGAHWEIWMMQQGGMSNMQALKTATINPAKSLGYDDNIGSLQVGKLADLIVLDKNPLENIRNTESIKYTMVNGRLYDAETMNEVGNYNKPRTRFYWETGRNVPAFDWHDGDTHTFGYGHVCD